MKRKKNKKFKVKLIFSDAPDAEKRFSQVMEILLPREDIFKHINKKDKNHGHM